MIVLTYKNAFLNTKNTLNNLYDSIIFILKIYTV
jgi:hypothetical protein